MSAVFHSIGTVQLGCQSEKTVRTTTLKSIERKSYAAYLLTNI
jgi:hypothetical protein